MDARARREVLRRHLNQARAALDAGDHRSALAHVDAALALDPGCLAAQALKEGVDATSAPAGAFSGEGGAVARHGAEGTGPNRDRRPHTSPLPPVNLQPEISSLQLQPSGWARFEQRARLRRIARRAGQARNEIARRRIAEAAMIVNEIRELDPEHPEILALSVELDAASLRTAGARRAGAAVAATVVFVASMLGARLLDAPQSRPRTAVQMVAHDLVLPAAAGLPVASPSAAGDRLRGRELYFPALDVRAPERRPVLVQVWPPAPPSDDAPLVSRVQASAGAAAASPSAPDGSAPPPRPAPRLDSAPQPESSARPEAQQPAAGREEASVQPRPPGPAREYDDRAGEQRARLEPTAGITLPGALAPQPIATMLATVPAPARSPAAIAPVADEELVRRLLQQFRRAYEELDARSARAVWPGVDEVALQRAFDGLERQRLTFADCEIQVRGMSGLAVCRGSARYVPKIGSREPRDEPRVWRFTMRKTGEGSWHIDTARAEQ